MNPIIEVYSRDLIHDAIARLPTHSTVMVISITSGKEWPDIPPVSLGAYIKLSFDDVDQDLGRMTPKQAQIIADAYDQLKDKLTHILINCDAGISRSAGVASALSYAVYGNDTMYTSARHTVPNTWVKKLVLEALGWSNSYDEWKEHGNDS